ncbi:protein FAM170A-like [Mustela putorius furo]|uniref:Protein FAM170A-like n=1 Tax=Mustela putorius furo TaxID=9669 RepID=A0A8U0RHY6_MUSPF|nr:protein FAM170A-like [Mustela putorius furo]
MKRKQKRKHLESPSSPPSAKKSREDLENQQKAAASNSVQMTKKASSSSSEYFSINSLENKLTGAEFKTTQEVGAHPKSSAVVPPGGEAAEESSASSYYTCFSSISQIIRANQDEFKTTQEVGAHPKSSAVVPPGGEAAEESSASSYYTCFSSISQIIRANQDGAPQTDQLVSCSKKCETSSHFLYSSFTLQLANDPKPSVSSANTERGNIHECLLYECKNKKGEQSPPSCTTKEPPTCSASRQTIEEQEKGKEADSPPVPPAAEEYPRAKTPEWLVTLDSGFRCMACCRGSFLAWRSSRNT